MTKDLIQFFINIGTLKRKQRKGWTVLHKIKNSESTADHSFRLVVLAWVLGRERKGLNLDKVIKMAILHDLCEVFAPDETPYDPLVKNKGRKKIEEIIKIRSRLQYTPEQRAQRIEQKFQSELAGLEKLVQDLPADLKIEMKSLWLEFTKGLSKEGRFAHQLDKMENLLQAMEYWQEQGQIQRDMWVLAGKEWCTDPDLAKVLEGIDKKFPPKKK